MVMNGRVKGRMAAIAVAAAVALGSGATPALALADTFITKAETLNCSGGGCVDSWEVKCVEMSHQLCVTVENTIDAPGGIQPTLFVAGVATAPAGILGQAYVELSIDPDVQFCFEKSGIPAPI